jgi:hypothetical protein
MTRTFRVIGRPGGWSARTPLANTEPTANSRITDAITLQALFWHMVDPPIKIGRNIDQPGRQVGAKSQWPFEVEQLSSPLQAVVIR